MTIFQVWQLHCNYIQTNSVKIDLQSHGWSAQRHRRACVVAVTMPFWWPLGCRQIWCVRTPFEKQAFESTWKEKKWVAALCSSLGAWLSGGLPSPL